MAHHDSLTGLPNRIGLKRYLEDISETAAGSRDMYTFLCLDLDGFKNVNDTFGHHVGDVILQEVAKRLYQIIEKKGIVARMGGDEFVIVLQPFSVSDVKSCNEIVTLIIDTLNLPFL